jgi:hypothetical protein
METRVLGEKMFRGRIRGYRFLAICFLGVALLLGAVLQASASISPKDAGNQTYVLPICSPKSSMEMQLCDPKEAEPSVVFSFGDRLSKISALQKSGAAAQIDTLDKSYHQMSARIQFRPSTELRVSFLYNQDQSTGQSAIGPASHLLFRYSLDYCIMPTLKVGMSGYLYKPPTDYFAWRNSLNFADPVYGFGPGIQYDLGRWSFLLKSQFESRAKDRGGESLHNWFRVWYAF